jgi:hypothetical protein
MGQGDAAEHSPTADGAAAEQVTAGQADSAAQTGSRDSEAPATRNGDCVAVDFGQLGPRDDTEAPDRS